MSNPNGLVVIIAEETVRVASENTTTEGHIDQLNTGNHKAIGDQIASLLNQAGFNKKTKVSLGLESRYFFFLETKDLVLSHSTDQAIDFQLEEHLPIDAENMVAIHQGSHSIILDGSAVSRLLKYLSDEHEIVICLLFPTSFASALVGLNEGKANHGLFLVLHSDSVDAIRFKDGKAIEWNYHKGPPEEFQCDDEDSLFGVASAGNHEDWFRTQNIEFIDLTQESLVTSLSEYASNPSALNFAQRLNEKAGIKGERTNVWELLCVAILVFLLCLAGGLGFRAYGWNQMAGQMDDDIRSGFKRVLPNRRINGPIERLLKSELSNQKASNQILDHANRSALVLSNLESLLAALPSSIKFRIDSMTVTTDSVVLGGEVKSLSDLIKIKEALVDAGYEIPSENIARKFSLTLKWLVSGGGS